MKRFLIPVTAVLVLFLSCEGSKNQATQRDEQFMPQEDMKEALIKKNKDMMLQEMSMIEKYVQDKNLKMTKTPTGVYYQVLQEGIGKKVKMLDDVQMSFRMSELDGTYIYSSDSSGVLDFTVGKSDEPTGLQEAILQLNEGSKARFIIPSFHAYGITGDGNKIKGRETLIYEVELIKVKHN
jgi:FKBP-type peptidyl-prolyl cis-trans isomerase